MSFTSRSTVTSPFFSRAYSILYFLRCASPDTIAGKSLWHESARYCTGDACSVTRGLVIGKFYPPHRGDQFLIETALSQVDRLDVLICVRPDQTISGELRKQWLQEIHPTACVRAIDDPGEDDNSELWAKYTVRILGIAPDVVFTSEDYGEAYAHFLGCRHVLVDRERTHVPVSARAIRTGPLSYWEYLEPCVRAHFAKRVSVLGAESTGTTTLVRHLPNTTARFGCQST